MSVEDQIIEISDQQACGSVSSEFLKQVKLLHTELYGYVPDTNCGYCLIKACTDIAKVLKKKGYKHE